MNVYRSMADELVKISASVMGRLLNRDQFPTADMDGGLDAARGAPLVRRERDHPERVLDAFGPCTREHPLDPLGDPGITRSG